MTNEVPNKKELADALEAELARRAGGAAPAPRGAGAPKGSTATIAPKDWQKVLDNLATSGNFYRVKEGRTRIRLVAVPAESSDFFVEVNSTFRGKVRSKFLITGLVLDGKGAKEESAYTVTPIIVSKTVLKAIIGLLAEGYDLLSPDGYGLTLSRTGQGLDTEYTVMPSKNPIPYPEELVEPSQSLAEMALEFEEWSSRASDPDAGDGSTAEEEAPAPRRGGKPTGGRRTASEW